MSIEVHTPDTLAYQFYPVSGACFSFKVRSANDAHLALTTSQQESDPIYEVFLGGWSNSKSVIRKNRAKPDVVEVEVDTPGILSADEYRGFWIRWYDNRISVGREGEAAAFLWIHDFALHSINFVGVRTGLGASGTWLFEESQCIAPPTGSGTSGCWVPAAGGAVPPGAMEGGFDVNELMYVARARHVGKLIPGKLHPKCRKCFIPWAGREHEHSEYEVLCACTGTWVRVSNGEIPSNALPGGESKIGEPQFIGRAAHNGTVAVGRVQRSNGVCYVSYGGQEFAYSDFELLIDQQ